MTEQTVTEPTVTDQTTTPGVEPQAAPSGEPPRRTSAIGRRQLAIAGGVLAVAVVVGVALGTLIPGGRGSTLGVAAGYVPADAVIYLEARLDLPGDQRANLRAILDRFPAVDPDEILTDALADTLDEALAFAPFDYSGDIAPWFDGRVALAFLDYPIAADPMAMELPTMLAMVGVRDEAAATELTDTLRGEITSSGATFSSAEHRGVTVWSLDSDEMGLSMFAMSAGFAYAVTEDQIVMGSGADAVEAALDTHAGSDSLADRDELNALAEQLPDEWSGIVAVDVAGLMDEYRAQLEASEPALAEALAAYLDDLPPLAVSTIGFETDAVRMDGVTGNAGGSLAMENGQRGLAAHVPADAILFTDGGSVGAGLQQMIIAMEATLAAAPDGEQQLAQLEQIEEALGADLEDFVSWIGDAALVAGWDGSQPYGGLLLEADDPDAARDRLDQLRALASLAATTSGGEMTVTTEQVDGVEVTTITVDVDGTFADVNPMDATSGGVLVVEYAIDGDTALIGLGDRFVRRVLAIEEGDSLAASERYRAAVERFGGDDNAGVTFLDLAALREAVLGALPPEASGSLLDEIEPNVTPFDYFASVTRVEGDEVVSRAGVVLR